jgi:hypothetical protein
LISICSGTVVPSGNLPTSELVTSTSPRANTCPKVTGTLACVVPAEAVLSNLMFVTRSAGAIGVNTVVGVDGTRNATLVSEAAVAVGPATASSAELPLFAPITDAGALGAFAASALPDWPPPHATSKAPDTDARMVVYVEFSENFMLSLQVRQNRVDRARHKDYSTESNGDRKFVKRGSKSSAAQRKIDGKLSKLAKIEVKIASFWRFVRFSWQKKPPRRAAWETRNSLL